MAEPMQVYARVFAFAADKQSVWLLPENPRVEPDAWVSETPVYADSNSHHEVVLMLARHGLDAQDPRQVAYLHSTSWSEGRGVAVHTYVAVVEVEELVLTEWPGAYPVGVELFNSVGRPPVHGATERPEPNEIDVIFHALRHLRHEIENNREAAAALDADWHRHLTQSPLSSALATMFLVDDDGRRVAA